MEFFDSAWCPTCDKLIEPKRYTVTIPPPPSSPAPVEKSKKSKKSKPAPPPPPPPAPKYRTVIDQCPLPLYCSDECRAADLSSMCGLSISYDPARDMPPVPQNSFEDIIHDGPIDPSYSPAAEYAHLGKSMATLATIYNFPPLPRVPTPPPVEWESSSPSSYESGVMMAARRIKAALSPPPPPKPRGMIRPNQPPPPEKPKVIPGWTDGSHEWRASVYNMSAPPRSPTESSSAPVRRRKKDPAAQIAEQERAARRQQRETEILYEKFNNSFVRRVGSAPIPDAPRRKERSLVPRGAEGMLLVPDVKLKAPAPNSYPRSPARSASSQSLPPAPKPVEMRSWSYDNMPMYPLPELPGQADRPRKRLFLFEDKPVQP